jgi:hypothetical protein
VKPVGEPDAGDRHVRFDERGWETGRCRMAQVTAPILDSTIATNFSLGPVSFRGEAEVGRAAESATSVENDPERTSRSDVAIMPH